MNMKNNEETTRKQRKDKVITFRLTQEDLERYENYCFEEQISMSVLLREQLRNILATLPRVELTENRGIKFGQDEYRPGVEFVQA